MIKAILVILMVISMLFSNNTLSGDYQDAQDTFRQHYTEGLRGFKGNHKMEFAFANFSTNADLMVEHYSNEFDKYQHGVWVTPLNNLTKAREEVDAHGNIKLVFKELLSSSVSDKWEAFHGSTNWVIYSVRDATTMEKKYIIVGAENPFIGKNRYHFYVGSENDIKYYYKEAKVPNRGSCIGDFPSCSIDVGEKFNTNVISKHTSRNDRGVCFRVGSMELKAQVLYSDVQVIFSLFDADRDVCSSYPYKY